MKHQLDTLIADYKAGKLDRRRVRDALARLQGGTRTCELSEVQLGLWIVQRSFPAMTAYNVPLALRVRGLSALTFATACRAAVAQHPVLSTMIERAGDRATQSIDAARPLDFAVIDLTEADEAEALRAVRAASLEPFRIEGGPLFRVRVFERSPREAIVLFAAHHIIFDGSSAALLIDSVFGAYQSLLAGGDVEPDAPAAAFHDAVRALRQRIDGERAAHLAYWRHQLAVPPPALALPTLRPHAALDDRFAGTTYLRALPGALRRRLAARSAAARGFASTALLAAYAVALGELAGQRELVIGVPVNERRGAEDARVMGLLINMVPIRIRLDAAAT
ncbi:MAG TPA: condensation domain-containing protein, partial [Kofleriaceae bacterium]